MTETELRSHNDDAGLVVKSWTMNHVYVRGDDDDDARGVPDAHGDGDDGGGVWTRRWMNRTRPMRTNDVSWWATSPVDVCSPDLSRNPSTKNKN